MTVGALPAQNIDTYSRGTARDSLHRNIPTDARRAIARALSSHYDELAGNEFTETPQFSVCRMLAAMAQRDGLREGHEAKICKSSALLKGEHFDPNRPIIPFTAFRDLTVGTTTAGGFLVGTNVAPSVIDILRPWSVSAAAGATILPGLVGNIALPLVKTAATGGWLSTEAAAAPQNEPIIGQAPILLALSTERLTLGRIPGHATRDGVELRSFGFTRETALS